MSTKQLLIVANQPSENTQRLAQCVLRGAEHPDVLGVVATLAHPLDACADNESVRRILTTHYPSDPSGGGPPWAKSWSAQRTAFGASNCFAANPSA